MFEDGHCRAVLHGEHLCNLFVFECLEQFWDSVETLFECLEHFLNV